MAEFGPVEQFRKSQVYVKRLLSDLLRRTTERIALEFGRTGLTCYILWVKILAYMSHHKTRLTKSATLSNIAL